MAKWSGNVGYAHLEKTAPGVFEEVIIERHYYGDVFQNTRRLESSSQINDNINVNNRISIVADPYARDNFHDMRYIQFMGKKWKISDVAVEYPRLILTIGGLYNGETENGIADMP